MVAVPPNNGNPHYEPTRENSKPIRAGDLLLLDIWAKFKKPGSVFYDITWVGYLGDRVPEKYAKIFGIVKSARDAAVNLSPNRWPRKAPCTDGKWIARRAA